MKKILNNVRNNCMKIKLSSVFVLLSFASVFLTIIVLLFSHGSLFSSIFFRDSLDTGMDFFHSIEYTRGRMPYEKFSTLYPPLANVCFYFLFMLIPEWQYSQWSDTFKDGIAARGTYVDLRVWQPTLFIFIVFIIVSTICLFVIIRCIVSDCSYANLVAICCIFSFGILYALERGNIIVISVACCLFFFKYKNSNNKVLSELALILLAISAGLKLYPAIFGITLIYDKQYKKAVRAIIYGLLFFFVPFLAFKEGFGGLPIFLNTLFGFGETEGLSTSGFSFDKIINSLAVLLNHYLGVSINDNVLVNVGSILNIVISVLILLCGFSLKKYWHKILCCCLAIVLVQSQGVYMMSFFMLPLVFMITEEERISKKNAIPFLALVFSQLLLPIWNNENQLIPIVSGRFQLCILILSIYILILCGINFGVKRCNRLKKNS